MESGKKRCMVCGKPHDGGQSICRPCNESIRGEASGKQKKMIKQARKESTRNGQTPGE